MIFADKCLELGLPEPHKAEDHMHFVTRVIAEGYNLNVKVCRYIGIQDLYSIMVKLFKLGLDFTWMTAPFYCPLLKHTPSEPEIVIYMTMEQQNKYWRAKRKPIKEVTQ